MTSKTYVFLIGLVFSCLMARTQPITDSEARKTGLFIEKSTSSGDPSAIDHFLFPDSLVQRIRAKSRFLKDPQTFAGFKSSFIPSFTNSHLGKQIVANVRNGNYKLMRVFDNGGGKHLLFRSFGDGGLNYHDFVLARVGDSIKAADLYTYAADEWTSSAVARLSDIMGRSNSFEEDGNIILKMTEQTNKADYNGVRTTYEQLGPEYKRSKVIQIMFIQACHHIDLGLYEKALVGYAETFPDAASSYLQLLDLYYLQKEFDKGLAAVDKLARVVGGDPLLDFFRGNFYTLMGKNAESLHCYENVYQYDPGIKINSVKLASVYAAANQNDKAKAVIAGYMNTASYHPGDLNALYDKYPDLR